MTKKSQPSGAEDVNSDGAQPPQEKIRQAVVPTVKFAGAHNGDRLSFEVEGVDSPAELVVELNGKPWGRAVLQEPLTVVAGPLLPASYGIEYIVQPINQ